MPFYGNMYYWISGFSHVGAWTKIEFFVGSITIPRGCFYCPPGNNCPGGGNHISGTHDDITKYTNIEAKFTTCDGSVWQELEYYFEQDANNSNKHHIHVRRLNGTWPTAPVGYILFTEAIAPGCSLINIYCDELVTNPIEFELTENDNSMGGIDEACNDIETLAFFSYRPKSGGSIYVTNFFNEYNKDSISVCFNKQTQFFQFKVNTGPKWNTVVDICENNIQSRHLTIVESIADISIKVPKSLCFKALRSFKGHLKYPYKIEEYGFAIKDVLLSHERVHMRKFNDLYVKGHRGLLNWLLSKFRPECDEYTDLDILKNDAFNKFYINVSKYLAEIGYLYEVSEGYHEIYKSLPTLQEKIRNKIETETNTDQEVVDKIQSYIDALQTYCNSSN